MSDDIEQRLSAAAQAARELEVTRGRCADLQARQDQLGSELDALQEQYQVEQKELDRLEHVSLTRVLVALKGSREEALTREHAEADAVRLRVADAQARLEAVRAEHQAALDQIDHLASAPDTYKAVLAEKERHLTESSDPRRAPLLQLADERGRLNAELSEMQKALQAADAARRALSVVEDKLGSASGWNTYDTFFGGGMIATAMEHSRLDDAAAAAAEADRRMAVLRTDLTELDQVEQTSPLIHTQQRDEVRRPVVQQHLHRPRGARPDQAGSAECGPVLADGQRDRGTHESPVRRSTRQAHRDRGPAERPANC